MVLMKGGRVYRLRSLLSREVSSGVCLNDILMVKGAIDRGVYVQFNDLNFFHQSAEPRYL
jgi:hypothetical protein